MKNAAGYLLALVAISAPALAQNAAPSDRMSVVPFAIVKSGGALRPTIMASFNGHPFRMMLHSQARFPGGEIQLRHSQAARFGISGLHRGIKYGIDRPGHASDLGSDSGTIARLVVGKTIEHDVPVSVFEVPQDNLGMLGVDWLRRARVTLNFATQMATVEPTAAHLASVRRSLLADGYRAIPLAIKSHFFTVKVSVNGVSRDMAIGSASENGLDVAFAAAAGVSHDQGGNYGSGPTGTNAFVSNATTRVKFEIDGWISPAISKTTVSDIYGYNAQARPADQTLAIGGCLGDTFLAETRAVVDFGNGILYVHD